MELIRLTTWIDAPEDRCFRLATSAGFHRVLSRGAGTTQSPEAEQDALRSGDRLIWPGRQAGMQLKYTTRITALRPPCYFGEVLESGYFQHFEHDHHFTFLNDGTRMRDEMRFIVPPGPQCLITIPLVRRYLIARIVQRNQILKIAAESEEWKRYISPVADKLDDQCPEPPTVREKAEPSRHSAGQMATHRG